MKENGVALRAQTTTARTNDQKTGLARRETSPLTASKGVCVFICTYIYMIFGVTETNEEERQRCFDQLKR